MKFSQDNRRVFLKKAGLLTAGTFLAGNFAPKVHAGENNTIEVALIGSGSRGGGAIQQALSADSNVKLKAVADVFKDKTNAIFNHLKESMPEKLDMSEEQCFVGFDAYKKAIDVLKPGSVVVMAAPPGFRPLHMDYAVRKGMHVFAEKPLAVDIPGLRSLKETYKMSQEKNLKIGIGLNNRHYQRTAETIDAIHEGKLGDIVSLWVYRLQSTHHLRERRNQSLLEFQLRHIFNFNWTTGGFIVDALIHNLDVCTWAIGQIPVAAQGQGGRIIRTSKDELIDHAAVEYIFADGRKMMMQTKNMDNTWACFRATVHGTKGCAAVGEGVGDPRIYGDYSEKNVIWSPKSAWNDSYQTEHDRLFKAIREDQDWNELERGIDATFTPILGRMAVDMGTYLRADAAWTSDFEYAPNLAEMDYDSPAPAQPDENGNYPVPVPGVTRYVQ